MNLLSCDLNQCGIAGPSPRPLSGPLTYVTPNQPGQPSASCHITQIGDTLSGPMMIMESEDLRSSPTSRLRFAMRDYGAAVVR